MGDDRATMMPRGRRPRSPRQFRNRHGDDGDGQYDDLPVIPVTGLPGNPIVLPRSEHTISRRFIDPDALKVMGRLIRHGYRAFLVGGGVRDLLLGKRPKDFDIGTDATPEMVRSLFRNSRLIGRRFRIVHIFFGGNKIFEIATFRQTTDPELDVDGEVVIQKSDNTWGDPETDAIRRDLTINGLFYDLASFSVIDYVGGIDDLKNGIIRVIGDPDTRFGEDPVRMIRAIRHAARTGFTIEPHTYESIVRNAALIEKSAPARVFEELVRELRGGVSLQSLESLFRTGLLSSLIPPLHESMNSGGEQSWNLLARTLEALDQECLRNPDLSLAVIFLALMIGNIPESFLAGELSGDAREVFHALWRPVPLLSSERMREGIDPSRLQDPIGSSEQIADDDEKEPSDARTPEEGNEPVGKLRRLQASIAEKSIEKLFRPIGVPRRERERMRQILCGRAELFQAFLERSYPRSLVSRSYFGDVVRLLRLTAHAPIVEDCLAWLEEPSGAERPRRSRHRRRRRRGRESGPSE